MSTLSGYRHFLPDGTFGLHIDPVTGDIKSGPAPSPPAKKRGRPRKPMLPAPPPELSRGAPERTSNRTLISNARISARREGVPFTLTTAWLNARLRASHVCCDLTGTLMSGQDAYAPALYRKEPAAGFTPENTLVVCRALANALRYGETTLMQLVDKMRTRPDPR